MLFAVAELFDVELLPRIRNWRSLTLFRPDLKMNLSHTGHLYGGTINWELIESHPLRSKAVASHRLGR